MATRGIEWAAGLFEGEGSISVTNREGRRKYATLKLGMTDEDVVRAFAELFPGIGNVTRAHPPSSRDLGRKPSYVWNVTGLGALNVGFQLLPYFGKRRTERFLEVVNAVLTQDGVEQDAESNVSILPSRKVGNQ